MRPGVGRRRDEVDAVLAVLVRLEVGGSWSVSQAAQHLRERVADEAVLRRARARVRWALAERSSAFGERAAAALDLALPSPPSGPRGRPAPTVVVTDGSA